MNTIDRFIQALDDHDWMLTHKFGECMTLHRDGRIDGIIVQRMCNSGVWWIMHGDDYYSKPDRERLRKALSIKCNILFEDFRQRIILEQQAAMNEKLETLL